MCSEGNYANTPVAKLFVYSFTILTDPEMRLVPVPGHTMD
jgi:hypothetical protein